MIVEVGCPDPSNMISLNPLWLIVLIAEGGDSSTPTSFGPRDSMEFLRSVHQSKSLFSIEVVLPNKPEKGLENGEYEFKVFSLK
jgi:hypothetical protein